jgi:hypothetical protein
MKTIKEAAKEQANNPIIVAQGYKLTAYNSFIAGVEFAQRWISVEDELPPCSDEDILIKGTDYRGHEGVVDIGYMHEKTPRVENFISLSGEVLKVTHWRKIELIINNK